jgi:small redox-active disulfide protein 2
MRITVYGPGCAKCTETERIVAQAVGQAGVEAEIEHVKDIAQIARAGILMTPGVAIDGTVVVKGRVPAVADLVNAIRAAAHRRAAEGAAS